jgi:hypothetical protein
MNQTPDRLRMHAELIRDFTDADETSWLWAYERHDLPGDWQVLWRVAWAKSDRWSSGAA